MALRLSAKLPVAPRPRFGLGIVTAARVRHWPGYLLAAALTSGTLAVRLLMDGMLAGQPTLVIFTLPIMISAYVGGLGPGLVATALSYLAANYFVLAPGHAVGIAAVATRWDQVFVGLSGVVISCLNEALHHARRRSEIATAKQKRSQENLTLAIKETGDFRAALNEHAIVATTTPEGKITFVNDKFCAISKFSREELLSQDHRIISSKYHTTEFIRDLWATIRGGRVWHGEMKNKAKDGTFYWVDTTIVPFLDEQNRPRKYVAIRADITERKRADEEILRLNASLEQRVARRTSQLEEANAALRHSRAELTSVFESLPGLYLVLTPDLRIVAASDAYLKATHTTREGILGHNVFEMFPHNPGDPESAKTLQNVQASIKRVLQSGSADTMAIQKHDVRRPDGVFEERYWSPINSPVLGADRQITFIVHRVEEVTDFMRSKGQQTVSVPDLRGRMEQMEAEIFQNSQKMQATNLQLEAANQELEAFTYSVSHDLRAPLRAIDGFSHALLQEFGAILPAAAQRQIRIICDSAGRMGRLINDLLAFSRLSREPMRKRIVQTEQLVRVTLAEMASQSEGRELEVTIGELPACEGDLGLLKQVWVNLLSNAIKYSRNRSTARVEVGCVEEKGERVYFVRDNGCGFDMRYADKLFGVFQRLHRADEFEGTGVGLAIVQRLVQRHGGRVWAEAAVDQGATFYFTLPGSKTTVQS